MGKREIVVLMGTCGKSAGADRVYDKFTSVLKAKSITGVELKQSGCAGLCYSEVNVKTWRDGKEYIYAQITDDDVENFIDSEIIENKAYSKKILFEAAIGDDAALFPKQKRIVLRNCGKITPTSIDDYISKDGYKAITRVLKMPQELVVQEIKDSGLRGRGGAGFPTGLKWELTRKNPAPEGRYFICNADEGDPGAFMDRSVLEGDPHSVIEGMLIGAYAIGANKGYIYVRAEYPLAVKHCLKAIEDAKARGFLGKNIMDSDFSFDLKTKEGAGAFVCGEETALIASIEGKRGMPSLRPPYPAEKGVFGKSTVINNVETLANIPWIILNGGSKYSETGYEKSRGTKVFALAGKIKKGGLVEVPMGTTLREVIYDIGGGMAVPEYKFKAVQLGGPSGGCIPEKLLDLPVDYESLVKTGAIMGSGGMVIMDERSCMVDLARYFLNFTQNESCGKCTFCRLGTKRMLEILERICNGLGTMEELDLLQEIAKKCSTSSLCALGGSAPNPVLTTLKYFYDEYVEHIVNKKCPAKYCKKLLTYTISDKCVGCTACARKCPVKAISGEKKGRHIIDQQKCIKCGVCVATCKFDAIDTE
ncbi:MAG: NADH-quinone oxidoreductase subunit NuoF [Deltaproteobacteria bacterium]|nr:NADH-quinone oxidoreductase subunit NuoF [Deltaproteobacteria bacterium]